MSMKLGWGDMVHVIEDESRETIAQGVIVGGAIDECTHRFTSLTVDCTYGNGWHKDHEPQVTADPIHVELIEQGWHQKWYCRHYGR